jgi:hypothetical protein
VADAQLLMESEGRSSLAMGGGAYTLTLDYSHSNKRGPAGAVGGAGAPGSSEHGPGMDWVCDMCSCVNFARWGHQGWAPGVVCCSDCFSSCNAPAASHNARAGVVSLLHLHGSVPGQHSHVPTACSSTCRGVSPVTYKGGCFLSSGAVPEPCPNTLPSRPRLLPVPLSQPHTRLCLPPGAWSASNASQPAPPTRGAWMLTHTTSPPMLSRCLPSTPG